MRVGAVTIRGRGLLCVFVVVLVGSHNLSLVRGGISSKLLIARGTYPRDPSIQIMEHQKENQMEVGKKDIGPQSLQKLPTFAFLDP